VNIDVLLATLWRSVDGKKSRHDEQPPRQLNEASHTH
jgi:hypothetical protein